VKVNVTCAEKTVWIRVELPGTSEPLWFQKVFTEKVIAEVVRDAIADSFNNKVERIRREAYSAGRKRGQKLLTWFNGCFNSSNVGYGS